MAQPVEKIYSLKTLGYDQIITELDALAKKFVEIKKAKQDAAKTAAEAKKAQGEESQAYKDAVKLLDEQKVKELELKAAIKEKTNEAKAAQLVRQEEINQQKAAIAGNNAEVNSIAAIRKERAELNAAVIRVAPGNDVTFRGNTLQYDEAIEKLKQLSAVEQDFRRQFQKDGTLVGEYTTGIIQAFKSAGIDDLVRGQVSKANDQLGRLNEQFEVLKGELTSIKTTGEGAFDRINSQLNIVQKNGVTGFDSIIAKIREIGTNGGSSLEKIETILAEIKGSGSDAFKGIEEELNRIRIAGAGSFDNLEKSLLENRKAALALEQQVGGLQKELRGTGDIGNQITAGLANGFKNMKGQLSGFLLSYVGFQAAFQGIISGIDTAKELADQTTNLEIELDKTAGGADKLVAALAKLNTRTKLTDLEAIANIAAKAGVSEENLLGVTAALDKIKIAFGKDFGDIETGTESLVKLVNVFEGTDQVTGDNLLRVGNAVRTLANETVASVPFLNDFAKRMSGLKGISDITLPAVLGLASGFEQFGQSSEVAGTAVTKIIPKLATNTAKYAEIAGITQKAFADLLKDNPAEALIKVSEGLVKSKGGIEEISTAFADSQLGSGRIAAVLGTIGAKADDFRKAIASAGNAFDNTGNIEAAFQAKNENLASVLDKISKAFADASNSKAFQATLSIVSTLILALIHNLPALITILSLYTAGWALANREMIIARAELIFQRTIMPILNVLVGGQANAMRLYAIATQLAASGLRVLSTLMANPIFKIFAATIGLSLIALETFGKATNSLGDAFTRLGAKQAALKEIQIDANREIGETIAKENALLAIVKDRTIADETRSKALTELKNLAGGYLDQLNLENVLTEKGTRLIGDFNAQLERRARLNAADAIAQRENNKLTNLYQYQFDIQNAIKTQGEVNTSQFSKEFLDAYYKQQGRSASAIGKFIGDKVGVDFTYSGKDLNDFAKLVQNEIAQQLNKTTGAELAKTEVKAGNIKVLGQALGEAKAQVVELSEKLKGIKEGTKQYVDASAALTDAQNTVTRKRAELFAAMGKALPTAPAATNTGSNETIGVDELKKQLASVNAQIVEIDKIKTKTQVQVTDLKNLRIRRAELIKEIKEQGGTINIGASKISGQETDQFSIIESNTRRRLAEEETANIKIRETRKLTFDEEISYVKRVAAINTDGLNQKIGILNAQKSLNAKEKETLATLNKEKVDIELKTLNDIQEIHNREFTERQTVLRNQLDQQIAATKEANAIIQEDPNKSSQEKAQAKLDSDNKILALYKTFNENVDKLEKQLAQQTTRNSREIVKAQQQTSQDIIKDRTGVELGRIEDIQREGDIEVTQINGKYEETRTAILRNERLTSDQRTFLLERLAAANKVTILTSELETLQQEFTHKTLMYAQDLISEETYLKAKTELKKKQADLEEAMAEASRKRVQDLLDRKAKSLEDLASKEAQKGALKLFNVDDKDQEDAAALVGAAVAGSFALATDAMHNYYDAERQRIQDSLALNLERLDQEKQQVEARAQSQAEIDSIEKQYAQKKKDAQKAAGEEIKKSKRAELKIALVTEIANDAVAAAAYPFPFNLGIFAVMAGLAYGRYALGLSQINAQQFEKGGQVPRRGGKFGGKPHSKGGTPFKYQGEEYEAEVDELAIIRTRNAPARNKIFQIAGTHQQIASQLNVLGGGVSFAPGAKLKRFETGGFLGTNLQAPVFVPSSNNNVVNNTNSKELLDAIKEQNTSMNIYAAKIDSWQREFEVRQVTSTVTAAQKKQVQQKAIGTL